MQASCTSSTQWTLPRLLVHATNEVSRCCIRSPHAGVFYFLDKMGTAEAAASASDCAARCASTEGCDAYNFCPQDATDG